MLLKPFISYRESKGISIKHLRPIIHNTQVVEYLESKGVKAVDDIDNIVDKGHIVIRAHGVTPEIYDKICNKGLILEDATCPYVKKIHTLVKEKYEEGNKIIIVGDKKHPEVIGINGWCNNSAYIVNSAKDAEELAESDEKVCVVAQNHNYKGNIGYYK